MATVKHLILTRFNVPFTQWAHLLSDEWMEHRFSLFENICYPSIVGQTNQDFQWVMLCDPKTKPEWKKRIDSYSRLTPIYCDWEDRFSHILSFAEGETNLITTRLDNDDALNKHTIERIKGHYRGQAHHFINFPNVIVTDGRRVEKLCESSNPWVTLIESRPFKTVWSLKHGCARYSSITQDSTLVSGLRIIHGKNASNKLGRTTTPIRETPLEEFNINMSYLRGVR